MSVRDSRDGDQFHYYWAAKKCLRLLDPRSELCEVTIEGSSSSESGRFSEDAEDVIDVALYFRSQDPLESRTEYVQLKHSTMQQDVPWTASGLAKTIKKFYKVFCELKDKATAPATQERVTFQFVTNRPIEAKLREALDDLATGKTSRHQTLAKKLRSFCSDSSTTSLQSRRIHNRSKQSKASNSKLADEFFQVFRAIERQMGLHGQRAALVTESRNYFAASADSSLSALHELVSRKATTEFRTNPSILRADVLQVLKVDERDLFPTPSKLEESPQFFQREQHNEILSSIERAPGPVIVHADGGVGKSVFAGQLVHSVPPGSVTILYDCFGNGD